MAGPGPNAAFSTVALDIASIAGGESFGRIHRRMFPDPFGYGKNASRFSDPRRRIPENRFGVLYLGSSLNVCFVESVLRDQRDAIIGDIYLDELELDERLYSVFQVQESLSLVDLRDDCPLRMGIPSDVVRGRTQGLARNWSLALYEHPAMVDGIIYPSRLNNQTNLAIYDRAVRKLASVSTRPLSQTSGMVAVLKNFHVALI